MSELEGSSTATADNNAVADNWKHRSAKMSCRTCMWFVSKAPADPMAETSIGRCRKHAPTLNGWPTMFESDFCGDHKLDENKM